MPKNMRDLIKQYVEAVKKIYGSHVRQIILYGSYARGDFRPDFDYEMSSRKESIPVGNVIFTKSGQALRKAISTEKKEGF